MAPRNQKDKDGQDSESYEVIVLSQIAEDSANARRKQDEAIELISTSLPRFRGDDKETVESMIDMIRNAMRACVAASAFYAALPGVLSSDKSGVSLGTNTVPPVVRTYATSGGGPYGDVGPHGTGGTLGVSGGGGENRRLKMRALSSGDGMGARTQSPAVNEARARDRSSVAGTSAVVVNPVVPPRSERSDPFSDVASDWRDHHNPSESGASAMDAGYDSYGGDEDDPYDDAGFVVPRGFVSTGPKTGLDILRLAVGAAGQRDKGKGQALPVLGNVRSRSASGSTDRNGSRVCRVTSGAATPPASTALLPSTPISSPRHISSPPRSIGPVLSRPGAADPEKSAGKLRMRRLVI
jgi:hypothetical protein